MFTATRFTVVPSKDSRVRLEAALANKRPIARGERNRGAVIAIQAALADLNRGYLFAAEIDGYFGSRTYAAVESFQRDYGLVADGMVGRQTLSQLDALYSSDILRQPRGLSVHVGVDCLDVGHYGDAFTLKSCVNDARKMKELAETIGYDAVIYENENATVGNFTGFMRRAIEELFDGDALFITFSGHGSQIPNNSIDGEADNRDETLCFHDRMLVDDEFFALLAQFRKGVRIHAVFDSCHSGTVAKDIGEAADEQKEYKADVLKSLLFEEETAEGDLSGGDFGDRPILSGSLLKALDGDRPDLAAPPKQDPALNEEIAALFAELHTDELPTKDNKKQIDEADWSRIYNENKEVYDTVRNVVGPAEDKDLACSVVTLSACQDSQTTPAGNVYSLFTYRIISEWGQRGFVYSYKKLYQNLVGASSPDVTPAIHTYGSGRADSRLYERPFVF